MTLAPNDFTHLHVHSEFSLLDGLGRITELVDAAAPPGWIRWPSPTTERCTAPSRSTRRRTKGIKPIIGVETMSRPARWSTRRARPTASPTTSSCWPRTTGYQNLCRLVTDAHIDGYYYKPRIDQDHLAKYSEGLIGLSACLNGEVAQALEVEDWDLARTVAGGTATSSARTTSSSSSRTTACRSSAGSTSSSSASPPRSACRCRTNDLHYVRGDQSEAHDVLLCVGTGNNLDTPGRMRFETHEFYVKTAAQMGALFPDQPDAITNTRRIAEMTDLALPLGQLRIPHFPVPDGETVESWLRKECQRGLERRYGGVTPELQQRLDYELGVITSMGYAGYFLIVADFMRFAREQGIQTTCRGTAPGSIVTYTLGITPVDPILYGCRSSASSTPTG